MPTTFVAEKVLTGAIGKACQAAPTSRARLAPCTGGHGLAGNGHLSSVPRTLATTTEARDAARLLDRLGKPYRVASAVVRPLRKHDAAVSVLTHSPSPVVSRPTALLRPTNPDIGNLAAPSTFYTAIPLPFWRHLFKAISFRVDSNRLAAVGDRETRVLPTILVEVACTLASKRAHDMQERDFLGATRGLGSGVVNVALARGPG